VRSSTFHYLFVRPLGLTAYGQFLYVDTTTTTESGDSPTQFGTLTTIPVTNPFIPADLVFCGSGMTICWLLATELPITQAVFICCTNVKLRSLAEFMAKEIAAQDAFLPACHPASTRCFPCFGLDDDMLIMVSRQANDSDGIRAIVNSNGGTILPTRASDRSHL